MSSLDYLRKRSDYICQLKFHAAVKWILHLRNHSGSWEPVVSDKLIESNSSASSSDSFDHSDPEKVVLLEVKSEEEFAPIKNARGPRSCRYCSHSMCFASRSPPTSRLLNTSGKCY